MKVSDGEQSLFLIFYPRFEPKKDNLYIYSKTGHYPFVLL